MNKKILMVGIGTTLIAATTAHADYIQDAAELLSQKKIEISDLEQKFTAIEIKAVQAKVQEMQEKSDNKQKSIRSLINKRERELKKAGTKKSTEDQERDRDRTKDLEKEIQIKEKQQSKEKNLVGDLEKTVNRRFENLENRVSNLEKKAKTTNVNTKNSSSKPTSKKTTESKKNPKVSKSEAVDLVLRGKLGDGEQRKEVLRKSGFTEAEIKEIQKEVNRIIETDHIKVNLD